MAYALAGTVNIDFVQNPIGKNSEGKEIFLKDIWPSSKEINAHLEKAMNPETFAKIYDDIESSNETWNACAFTAAL